MENSMPRARAASLNVQKWMSFIAAIWIMAISGTNFDFSIYSSDLKGVLNINQIELNNLAEASDLGKLLGWVAGIACTVLPTWAVLGIAVLLGFIGYGVQWLVVGGMIQPLPYPVMYMLCFIAGNSICWFNTVCFKVAISNFPSCRGIAAGIALYGRTHRPPALNSLCSAQSCSVMEKNASSRVIDLDTMTMERNASSWVIDLGMVSTVKVQNKPWHNEHLEKLK